jgi:osmotically inducible protein OsmC
MPTRKAEATWTGTMKEGAGVLSVETGVLKNQAYDWKSRFETGAATNPEELLGAAHAGCFSMALSGALTRNNFPPERIHTTADVTITPLPTGSEITRIDLVTRAKVPGIDAAKFAEIAEATSKGCPVSKALKSVEITLNATLE